MGGEPMILLHRYRLGRLVGVGGFARVYLATDLQLNRSVAIKVLNPDLLHANQSGDFRRRFKDEAQAVAALDHPNILGIFDNGETADTVFLVMPFVEGGSLADRLRAAGRLTPQQAATYITQAAAALDHAHRRGLIHRDIKPQNMLLRAEDDRLLLADFGIAKLLREASSAQSRSAIVGTLAYMAPEQFQGQTSPAVDVYALGCLLFQLLTGEVPYAGATEQIMYGHMMAPIPSIVERSGGGIAPAVQEVIERTLAKDPRQRYLSTGDLARAFAAALQAETQRVAPIQQMPSLLAPGPMPSSRGLWWFLGATGAVLVTLLLIIALLIRSQQSPTPTATLAAARLPSSTVTSPITPTQTPIFALSPTSALAIAATSVPTVRPTNTLAPTATIQPTVTIPPIAAVPTLQGGKIYRDSQMRFSFSVPSSWIQIQAAGSEVAFQSPAPSGTIPATINVVLEKLPSNTVTLEEYDQAGEANLRQTFSDYRLISSTKVTFAGRPAYMRVYTATIAGRVLQLQQVYTVDGDVAYLMTGGSPVESFGQNASTFDQIIATFVIGR